jgi:hypothetical protein
LVEDEKDAELSEIEAMNRASAMRPPLILPRSRTPQ